MKKADLIDALKSQNVQDEEMQNMTMTQMADKLKEIRENSEQVIMKPEGLNVTEVTRSYTRKVNLGNYESEDFFCSRKAEVRPWDDIQAISNWIHYECKIDVQNLIDSRQAKDKAEKETLNF